MVGSSFVGLEVLLVLQVVGGFDQIVLSNVVRVHAVC